MAVFQNTSSNIVTTVADGTGTLSLVGNLWTSANAYIAGDLTVDGNVTYINITELNVEDPIISMGRGPNNTPLTGNDGKDRGIDMWYYTSTESSAFVGHQNSTGNLIAAVDVEINNEIVTVNYWGTFQAGRFYGDDLLVTSASIIGNVDAGNVRTQGQVTAAGNITGGNIRTAGLITATGNINTGNSVNVAGIVSAAGNIITNSNLSVTGQVSAGGNITTSSNLSVANQVSAGGNIVTNSNITATGLITAGGNVNTSNSVNATGLVSAGGNIVTNSNITATGLVTAAGNISTGNSVNVAGLVTATGNVTGGNILTGGQVSATGNVTGAYLVGNGSAITSISSSALPLATKTERGAIVGEVNSQIALGTDAGFTNQGIYGIAVGFDAAANNQGYESVAVGYLAGSQNQDHQSVAIGSSSGYQGQGRRAVAIGTQAGYNNQGQYSIAIGFEAGLTTQVDNSIILNAVAGQLNAAQSGLYIAPVRNDAGNIANAVFYNTTTKELTYASAISLTGNIVGGNVSTTGNVNGANIVGVIRPTAGTGVNGIVFPADPGGGSGDLATIQYYAPAGEATVLELAVNNDPDDTIKLNASGGVSVVGNITAGNVNTTNLSLSGNVLSAITTANTITGGLISSTGNITASGNIFGSSLTVIGNVVGSVDGYPMGYLTIPQVLLTANTTTAFSDIGKHYYSTSNVDISLTIANNSTIGWPVGSTITIVNQGTGNILIEQDSGVSLYLGGNSTAANRSVSSYGLATLINVAPDTWFINGSGVA